MAMEASLVSVLPEARHGQDAPPSRAPKGTYQSDATATPTTAPRAQGARQPAAAAAASQQRPRTTWASFTSGCRGSMPTLRSKSAQGPRRPAWEPLCAVK